MADDPEAARWKEALEQFDVPARAIAAFLEKEDEDVLGAFAEAVLDSG